MTNSDNQNIYTQVTESIIKSLSQGERPWFRPWVNAERLGEIGIPIRQSGDFYSGINVLLLWMSAFSKGYLSPHWMTFAQAKKLGSSVKKGEKSARVVYAGKAEKEEENKDGEREKKEIFFLKAYSVFNADQIQGLPSDYYREPQTPVNPDIPIGKAEQFFARIGAEVQCAGNRAFYNPDEDFIRMPRFEAFRSSGAHVATLAHEFIHWTGHRDRLNRDFGVRGDGDLKRRAIEELVAEIGSAFLCAHLGITPSVQDNHALYIKNWLTALETDAKYVFIAASIAQKAVDYLLSKGGAEPA